MFSKRAEVHFGDRGRGARRLVLAAVLGALAAGAAPARADSTAAPSEAAGDTVWTAVYLPDGAILYVRYGEPGAVHITSRPGGADSLAVPGDVGAAGPAVAPAVVTESERREMVLRILREELARLRGETGGPPDAGAEPLPSTAVAPGRDLDLAVIRRTAPRLADSLAAGAADTVGLDAVATPEANLLPGTEPGTGRGADSGQEPPVAAIRTPGPAAASPETRMVREEFLDSGLFSTSLVLFESNRSELLPSSRGVLRAVGEALRDFPEARLRVEGHSDARGPAELNLRLSRERAEAVREFLVTEAGLSPERVEAVGYGEDRPLAEGTSSTALTLNRRVEFRILNPEALRRVVGDR